VSLYKVQVRCDAHEVTICTFVRTLAAGDPVGPWRFDWTAARGGGPGGSHIKEWYDEPRPDRLVSTCVDGLVSIVCARCRRVLWRIGFDKAASACELLDGVAPGRSFDVSLAEFRRVVAGVR
jgi:hypothetical protein